jgi:hypothetical protein
MHFKIHSCGFILLFYKLLYIHIFWFTLLCMFELSDHWHKHLAQLLRHQWLDLRLWKWQRKKSFKDERSKVVKYREVTRNRASNTGQSVFTGVKYMQSHRLCICQFQNRVHWYLKCLSENYFRNVSLFGKMFFGQIWNLFWWGQDTQHDDTKHNDTQ